MASTYEPIATTTLGSAAGTITFSSIPGTYTDLRVIVSSKCSDGFNTFGMYFNGSTGSAYSVIKLYGNGSSATTAASTGAADIEVGYSGTGQFTVTTIDVFNYAGSTYKNILAQSAGDQNGSGQVGSRVGLWRSTAAITSLILTQTAYGGNFTIGTTANLYGILKA